MIRALMCLLQHKTPEEAFNTSLKYGQIVHFDFMLSSDSLEILTRQ
jgi:hypothetical protein